MNREPEPELMNSKEQVKAYSGADFSYGEKKFVDFIIYYLIKNKIKLSCDDIIVDLGCGPGNISEKLSNKMPEVKVFGIDGSFEMIKMAKDRLFENQNKYKLDNLSYICTDIKNLHLSKIFPKKNISLLVSNSFIHHLTDIDQFFDCIINLSSKDTINFHKDLIRPEDEKSALRLKNQCSLIYNEVLTNDYYASLKASYKKNELEKKILEKNLYSLDVVEDDENYLIVYGKV